MLEHCPESGQPTSSSAVPGFPVFFQPFPRPRLASAASVALQRNSSMCDPEQNTVARSLGHQVFRLLAHLCWGDRERKVWLMKPYTAVPIGATRQSTMSMCQPALRNLRHNFHGTIRRWAKPATVRRKHTNGLLLAMYPAQTCRERSNRWYTLMHPAFTWGRRIGSSEWSLQVAGSRPA